MSEPTAAPRPKAVTLLWVYCGMTMAISLLIFVGAICTVVFADDIDPDEEYEFLYVISGFVCALVLVGILLHAVPAFLKRNAATWTVINGMLIAYLVFWVVSFWPMAVIPILFLVQWSKQHVKDYYGVPIAPAQPRHWKDDWDDGWDEKWDRPRR